MNALIALLILYFVFSVYLLLAGAGRERLDSVLRTAGPFSLLAGFVIGALATFKSLSAGVQAFLFTTLFASLIALPVMASIRAREFVLPRSSVLEVVCLNALVMAIGQPPSSYGVLDLLCEGAFHVLLNPFVWILPPLPAFALSFWPSVLALRMAAQGEKASDRSRSFLLVWAILVGFTWIVPTAASAFMAFKAGSPGSYLDVLLACVALVYVWTTLVSMHNGFWLASSGRQRRIPGELAGRMSTGRWSPIVYVVAGLLTYAITWVALLNLLDPLTASTIGLVSIVVAGALVEGTAGQGNTDAEPRRVWIPWVICALLLVVPLTLLQPLARELWYKQARTRSEEVLKESRYASAVTPIDPATRPCALEGALPYNLRCPENSGALGALGHPESIDMPFAVFIEDARDFALTFGERRLNCMEIPAKTQLPDGSDTDAVLLLVYDPTATSVSQFAWVMDLDASCGRILELNPRRVEYARTGFFYVWNAAEAKRRGEEYSLLAGFYELGPWKEPAVKQATPQGPADFLHTRDVRELSELSPAQCRLLEQTLVLRCGHRDWQLAAISHPPRLDLPLSIETRVGRQFELRFRERNLSCIQFPARVDVDGRPTTAWFLLVSYPDAIDASGYGWVVEPSAGCENLAEGRLEASSGTAPVAYRWRGDTARKRGEDYGVIGMLKSGVSRSGQEQRAQP
jgi:hypothetical protein